MHSFEQLHHFMKGYTVLKTVHWGTEHQHECQRRQAVSKLWCIYQQSLTNRHVSHMRLAGCMASDLSCLKIYCPDEFSSPSHTQSHLGRGNLKWRPAWVRMTCENVWEERLSWLTWEGPPKVHSTTLRQVALDCLKKPAGWKKASQ